MPAVGLRVIYSAPPVCVRQSLLVEGELPGRFRGGGLVSICVVPLLLRLQLHFMLTP